MPDCLILIAPADHNGTPVLQEELDCKTIIDRLHTDNPGWEGCPSDVFTTKMRGQKVGRRKHAAQHLAEMGINPSIPK